MVFVTSQLLKRSWRSNGSGRDNAIPLLQCIPRRRKTGKGWGRPHILRYSWVFLHSLILVTSLLLLRVLCRALAK